MRQPSLTTKPAEVHQRFIHGRGGRCGPAARDDVLDHYSRAERNKCVNRPLGNAHVSVASARRFPIYRVHQDVFGGRGRANNDFVREALR